MKTIKLWRFENNVYKGEGKTLVEAFYELNKVVDFYEKYADFDYDELEESVRRGYLTIGTDISSCIFAAFSLADRFSSGYFDLFVDDSWPDEDALFTDVFAFWDVLETYIPYPRAQDTTITKISAVENQIKNFFTKTAP